MCASIVGKELGAYFYFEVRMQNSLNTVLLEALKLLVISSD